MFISRSFDEIKNEFDNNKNSHSYIFYTNDFFSCQKDIYSLMKYLFNTENLSLIESDFVVIKKSDNKSILKDDMQNLKNFFQNTSYLNRYRIYLIEESHKLNATTSNMILKFLEEPMDRVVAFFITTNLDSVLSTIKSRCQIVNVFYENTEGKVVNDISFLKDFFEKDKLLNIVKAKKHFEKFNRNELIDLFSRYLDDCYKDYLNLECILKIKKLIML